MYFKKIYHSNPLASKNFFKGSVWMLKSFEITLKPRQNFVLL